MILALLLLLALPGQAKLELVTSCDAAAAFDVPGALVALQDPAAHDCEDAAVAAGYLQGLLDAEAAVALGGNPESLAPVRLAVERLETIGARRPGAPAVSALLLRAAAAAAQFERDEMALLLDEAVRREVLLLSSGQPPVMMISAHELGGELWLRVHRFDSAGDAFTEAMGAVGRTPRVLLGLARTSAGLGDVAGACDMYAALVAAWREGPDEPAEIIEAQGQLALAPCRARR